jgi:tetratricopeptide (TPR) repeat protein
LFIPDSSVLYLSRGEAREKGGNIKGAKEDYKKALELNPEDDWAQYHLDCIESSENQEKEFNIEYEKSTKYIKDNPNDPDGYFNRGYLLYYNEVDDNIALSDFDKAIELNPNYIEARKYKTYIMNV